MVRPQFRARDGCVRHDERAKLLVRGNPGDRVDIGGFEIGGDLEENWRSVFAARLEHGVEQAGQRAFVLQRAQARRIGAGDVDREIGRERGHDARHRGVVGNPVLAVLVGANVDAEHTGTPLPRRESLRRNRRAAVVEAHPVDHRAVLDQPEQARLGIARLRTRGDRADLGKAEAQRQQLVRDLAILVEARRHAQRIGEGDS